MTVKVVSNMLASFVMSRGWTMNGYLEYNTEKTVSDKTLRLVE